MSSARSLRVNFNSKGVGTFVVAALECQEAFFDLRDVGEVVGGQHLALDDREGDLPYLVEPRRVVRDVDQVQVRAARRHSLDGCLAPV